MLRTAIKAGALAALVLPILTTPGAAWAGPAEYVYSPIVEEGERELEFKFGQSKARDGARESQHGLGFGLGVNRWWSTELFAQWHKLPGERQSFDAWEWENRFQLTETGRFPVDVGLVVEIERPKDRREGYEVRWGPLLQADLTSSLQANLNLLFERHTRGGDEGDAGKAELGYQWQLKYRWKPELEFGLQGLGDVGRWNKWEPHAEQPHRAGPAIFGRVKLGQKQAIKYDAALLFGMTDAAPRHTLRLKAEFEF